MSISPEANNTLSVYSPAIRREAAYLGITDLQAYRNAQARDHILRRREREREEAISFTLLNEAPSLRIDPQQCNACGAYTNGRCGCMDED